MYSQNNSISGMIGAEQLLYANANSAAEKAAKAFALQQQQQHIHINNNNGHLQQSQQYHNSSSSSSNNVVYSANSHLVNNSSSTLRTKQEGFARMPSPFTESSMLGSGSHIDLPFDIIDEPKTTLQDYH